MCAATLLLAGCSIDRPNRPIWSWLKHEISPAPARVGVETITFKLADARGKPIMGARFTVEADMSHAGMSPVFAEAKELEPGRYQAHLNLQMAGDWMILLHVTLPGGKKAGTTDRSKGRPTQLGKRLNPSSIPALETAESLPFDLLRVPVVGDLFRWRYARPLLQAPLLVLSVIMILHGLFGPTLAPKNLATTLSWLHFRGVLVLVLLCAGNFFCLACPFMLVRQWARRFFKPRFNWPRALRNKWISVGLFVLILFTYELFDLWSSPWWTAWLIVAYFLSVLVVDGFFKHASFCKFVCPIGQFNFVASTLSPFEVKVREQDVCTRCHTKDCIRGRREPVSDLVTIRGCELALFQPSKVGNMDCTFCLDCIHACPHDNIGILSRLPASELMVDPIRSVGRAGIRGAILARPIRS